VGKETIMNGINRTFDRALITGIKGSGASYLAEELVFNHPEVEVHGISRWHSTDTTNRNLRNVKDKIDMHDCDLMDLSRVMEVVKLVQPDVVFHLASHSNVKTSFLYPLAVMQNNVMGTANLLEAFRINVINPVFITISTSEVYGVVRQEDTPIGEKHPIQPVNPYAVSKLAQDALSYAYWMSYGLNVIRTRAFTYLNPRRHDIFATAFARQVAEIELGLRDVLHYGNLDSTRTIIDVRDCMEAYWYAAAHGTIGEVYNIGGRTVMSVDNFLELLKENARCKIKTEIDKDLLRPVDVTMQIPDTTKFQSDTGWYPRYSFQDSVKFFLEEVRRDVCHENEINYEEQYGPNGRL
jgi:GDP-4-dehydro-6-deoxy-D-mannose reductase